MDAFEGLWRRLRIREASTRLFEQVHPEGGDLVEGMPLLCCAPEFNGSEALEFLAALDWKTHYVGEEL